MTAPAQLLFLPGASGNTEFWKPVAGLLRMPGAAMRHVGWPGLGPTPADPSVTCVDDIAERVGAQIDRPTAIVAQSMGCVVAILAALEKPALVTHLVLAALSGGADLQRLGARDWRPSRPSNLFADYDEDLTTRLPAIAAPVLVLCGDSDPVSPVAVGQWLSQVLVRAQLHVLTGGTHTFASDRASEVAPLIQRHLAT